LQAGLDRANQLDPSGQIRFQARCDGPLKRIPDRQSRAVRAISRINGFRVIPSEQFPK
jgi:hypothetical protein